MEIGWSAFVGSNLNRVTFEGDLIMHIDSMMLNRSAFAGDLREKHEAGGAGTYTRPAGGGRGGTWTKQ